jgi:glycosyl transferase family 87
MSARSESSSRPAEAGGAGPAIALGVVFLTISWGLLHVGFWHRNPIIDTPVYQGYGEKIVDGKAPYRDFSVEYPPAALPVFVLPALADDDDYGSAFELLMWACAVATIVLLAVTLSAAGAGTVRLNAATAFAGIVPLLLGSVILTRFDLWPAALTAGALAALMSGRDRLGLGVLGLATAAKLYPAVLLPIALVSVARRRGAREAAVGLGVFATVIVAIVLPFAILSPGGVADSLTTQLGRPLQIESLGAAILLAAHQLGLYDPTVVSTHGSQNLSGSLPSALAAVETALQLVALVAVWLLFARGRPDRERLLVASAGAVVAFIAFGKVLSPQFLIWLLPLIPLVGGTAGIAACWVFAGALVTTQLWFPHRYWDVVALDPAGWLVLVRDLLLVALLAVLVAAIRPGSGAPRTS